MINSESSLDEKLADCRRLFESNQTIEYEERRKELIRLGKMIESNHDLFISALEKDLHKSKHESIITEIQPLTNEINHALTHLKEWMSKKELSTDLLTLLDERYLLPQPYGVVLVIGAWNYPLALTLIPVVGAIASGNVIMIKPSELSTNMESLLRELIPKYLKLTTIHCCDGEGTRRLLENRFDYIFFTGSSVTGRKVMESASKFMTPITLECGGKSPVVVTRQCNIDIAVSRICWGKLMNCGQTCIAPDYVLIEEEIFDEFLDKFKRKIIEYYGNDIKNNKDYGRIINNNHFNRLKTVLKPYIDEEEMDEKDLFIPPIIVPFDNLTMAKESSVMESELFGPILPIIKISQLSEAKQFIRSKEKPLAFYMFCTDEKIVEDFRNHSFSGAFVVNDVILQCASETMPFGGVGNAGIGHYHGKYTFEQFSHMKPVLIRKEFGETLFKDRYPPFQPKKTNGLRKIVAVGEHSQFVARLINFFCSILSFIIAPILSCVK
ncbi:hypothetical protein SNEBB_000022 [Seison nebaliae]|nr:hypothetical protein SNEBB_000022 [Seison nebaliae]